MAEMTKEEMAAIIEKLQGQVAAMKADSQRKLTLKVTEKGAVGVYGLGKWPVTLYRSQWEPLVELVKSGAVTRFIEANAERLSVKGDRA